jgi:eukaryotic-like serine/threonine-protein kinase
VQVAEQTSSADYRGSLGRYALYGEIAAGGMATVHVARLIGSVGFARTVAIKRLHPHLAKDPDFVGMFLDEARLAVRVRHPNVVATLDVVKDGKELFLVMEYVAGESLSRLVRKTREAGERMPPRYVGAIMCAALEGLHAAHDATSERGVPLGLVHRDISPQNIHVGIDGVARVLDFGIAKATNRVQETRTDQIKGKVAYMSPEQLAKGPIDRRADVYSASVVIWEALTGQRLFKADDVPALVYSIMNDYIRRPSEVVPDLPRGIDEVVMKGLDREAEKRWSSARELAVALERVLGTAPAREIGEWAEKTGGDALAWRIELVQRIESETSSSIPPGLLRASAKHSPSSPVEASGVVHTPAPLESDPTTQDRDRERGRGLGREYGLRIITGPPPREEIADVQVIDPGAVSVARISPPAEHSHVRLILISALILFVAGGLLALRLIQVGSDSATAAPAPTESVMPAIGLDVSRSASATTTAPPVPKALVFEAKAEPKPAPPPPVVNRPVVPATPPKPAATPVPNDCDNPFYVDAKGARRPKTHCFKR